MNRIESPSSESHPQPRAGGRPVHMTWTDPQDGDELWVEMWGTREFVDELLAQGFVIRAVGEDETLSSLCVRITQDGD